VVFDSGRIDNLSTFEHPPAPAAAIRQVTVNGELAVATAIPPEYWPAKLYPDVVMGEPPRPFRPGPTTSPLPPGRPFI
jgi:hypothetical protein